ncbi:B-cell receptor CD22-like [Scomber scombrus]|uniref:B-cell receptor CD22-like n=1 Tax=Scomber scombrus TaxID=13677 RepID=A0AAV1MYS7_SCOSC
MEALSGSCLQIPCNFSPKVAEEFDGSRETFGVWIKNDHRFGPYPNNVIFNSSQTINTYPMKITGNLNEKNCTTLFSNLTTTYTDKYYFRIVNEQFKATAYCDPLQITVRDSPLSPTIEISGELKEKESVTITCSAFTPCPHSPPKLTWNLQQDAHNKIEENTDRTFTAKIQKTITLSDKQDGYTITCSSIYSVNEGQNVKSAEGKVTLSVSYAPKDTSAMISPSGLVSPGSWVNLTCSSRAKPAANFTWFKINKDGLMKVSEGDFYSFNVTDLLDVYYCVATNNVGRQWSSEIHLTIKGHEHSRKLADVYIIVKAVGIVMLVSTMVIFECWFRTRRSTKPVKILLRAPQLESQVLRLMAVLSTNMLTVNILLSVFFLPGALAACPDDSALFITAPLKMEALSGSCLQIPCNFSVRVAEEFDGSRETFGVWIKSDLSFGTYPDNVIFNSSQTINTYPMKITGNLNEKYCTTLFSNLNTTYTNTYFFRIENRPFLATAVCDHLQITVRDSPPSPTIEISGELKEKESVTITCSAFTPCPHSPPKLTWNLQQDAHNKIEENTDRTFTTKIQKTITLSDKQDGYTITCSSIYSVNEGQNVKSAEGKVTLNVSSKPQGAVLGGIIGIIILIFLVVTVCTLLFFKWFKSTHPQQTESQTGEEQLAKTDEEGIHYGEINFSKQRPGQSSDSVQASREQQDIVYEQVKVSEPTNRFTQTADGPEELYAQVKNK